MKVFASFFKKKALFLFEKSCASAPDVKNQKTFIHLDPG